MIPDNHAKSFLSKSYINAVATQAGFGCQFNDPDYGIDARISEVQFVSENKFVNSGFHFNVQIKASHDFIKQNDEIVYALSSEAYNRMIYHKGGLMVLVLFCLPENPIDRISLCEDYLTLRNCCYWYHVGGELSTNKSSKTIHIPRAQIFDPEACLNLMECVRNDDWKNGNL